MRPSRLAALAAVLVFVADAESADTLASRFPQLATEVQNRLTVLLAAPKLTGAQKKQKSALTKAQKPLAVVTGDFATTLKDEHAAVAALNGVFKTDVTIAPMLDQIVANAQLDVSDFGNFVGDRAAALPDGSAKKKAQASLAAAAKLDTSAGVATKSRTTRLALIAKALSDVVKADGVVTKTPAAVAIDEMQALAGDRRLFAAAGTSSNASAIYVAAGSGALRVSAGFQSLGTGRILNFRVDAPNVAGHPVAIGGDSVFVDGDGALPATSGTVQITTWDPANQKAAGTFDIVYSDGTTTVHVTDGEFSFIDMQTQ